MHGEAGKGDRYRSVDRKRWDEGWEQTFGDKTMELLPIMGQPEFQKFSKVPRLSRDMIITEKIDGTNAQICVLESGQLFAGSRNRWLTIEDDNYGFCKWVFDHAEELTNGLGVGRHYGEWWGCGIQRGYGLKEKRFSLFNVRRWVREDRRNYFDYNEKTQLPPSCCSVVPILRWWPTFDIQTIVEELEQLKQRGSAAAPGFMRPEGIVICHVASGHLYKKTFENDEKGKGDE